MSSLLADTTLVTVFRDRHRRGFPQPPPATEPDAGFGLGDYAPGPLDGPPSTQGKRVCRSVREMISTPFATDAHFVTYVNLEVPLRLNHGVWAHSTETRIFVNCYDVDCPKHLRDERGFASEDWWRSEQEKISRLQAAEPGVIAFRSRGGYRLIGARKTPFQIVDESTSITWSRDYVLRGAWLYRAFGIVVDPSCRDWTRLQRTGLATREDGGREPGIVVGNLDRFGAWKYQGMLLPLATSALDTLAAEHKEWKAAQGAARREATDVPRAALPEPASVDFNLTGDFVQAAIQHIADNFPKKNRHALCQAIGGMLRNQGTTPECAYFIVYEGARRGGSTDPRTRAKAASDTWRLAREDAKTAYTTVCSIIGVDAASKLGDLFIHAKHEKILGPVYIERAKKEAQLAARAAEQAAAKPQAPRPAAPGRLIQLSDIREVVQKIKRKKASAEDPKQLIQALLLQRLIDGEPLSEPADEDATTGLSSEEALHKAVTVLAWNIEPGTPWAGIRAIVERAVIEMATDEKPVAYWMERGQQGFERALKSVEIAKEVQKADRRARWQRDAGVTR